MHITGVTCLVKGFFLAKDIGMQYILMQVINPVLSPLPSQVTEEISMIQVGEIFYVGHQRMSSFGDLY